MNGAYGNRIKMLGSLTRRLFPIAVNAAYLDNEVLFGNHRHSFPQRLTIAIDFLHAEVSAIQQESTDQRGS